MGGEESRELEASMLSVRRSCKLLKYLCIICLVAFSIAWIALEISMIVDLVAQQHGFEGLHLFLYATMHGFVAIILLFSFLRSFSDVASGCSPFTMKQVNLFRLAAILLIILSVVDAILSTGFLFNFQVAGVDVVAHGGQQVESGTLNIDLMTVLFAVVLYGVSVLFRYGVLLQRLTDETE